MLGLAPDVADDPAETGAQELDPSVHALELLCVGVAPGHHGGPLGEPRIGLAQFHIMFLGQSAELPDRRLQEPGIGREGAVLGLHGGIDRDPRQIRAPVSCAMRRLSCNTMSRQPPIRLRQWLMPDRS